MNILIRNLTDRNKDLFELEKQLELFSKKVALEAFFSPTRLTIAFCARWCNG